MFGNRIYYYLGRVQHVRQYDPRRQFVLILTLSHTGTKNLKMHPFMAAAAAAGGAAQQSGSDPATESVFVAARTATVFVTPRFL